MRRWHLRSLRRSLGLRIVALFVLLALAIAIVFSAGMRRALGGGWGEIVRPLLDDYAQRLVAEIGSPPDVDRAAALAARLQLAIRIEGPRVNWRSSAAGGRHRDEAWLERASADGHRIGFGIADSAWQQRPRRIGWITLALLIGVTALAWALLRRMLRPLDDIRAGAMRFGSGDFATPIPLRRDDELGQLARQVNTMADELRRRLDGQRALLLAISHELRSPLTRARLHAELVEEGASRDALLGDLAEMADLIHSLLESERLAGARAALNTEPTDLAALVRELVAERFESASITLDLADGVPAVAVDRLRLRLALRNLIDNALRHGGGGVAPPVVSLGVDAGAAVISVRDHGAGVGDDQLAKLAEPFWRADAARQRSTGGVGLGLYLSRLVAQAHGGRLDFRHARPGLQANLRLPLG